jgi:hypothetical protein
MSAAQRITTYRRSSTASPEVAFEVTGPKTPKELYADPPGRIVESESDMRVGCAAVTITDRS